MNKIIGTLVVGLSFLGAAWALSFEDLPSSFSTKIVPGTTQSIQVIAENQVIGTLSLSPESRVTQYVFVDAENQQITLKFKKYYGDALWFHIYDDNQHLIAQLMQEVPNAYRTNFYLYAADGKTMLATGVESAIRFKTMLTVYDKNSWDIVANVSRALYTWSRDADVTIDKAQLSSSALNPNVFLAVLALQSLHTISAETKIPHVQSSRMLDTASILDIQLLLDQTHDIAYEQKLGDKVSVADQKSAGELLRKLYREELDGTHFSESEQTIQFTEFCHQQLQTNHFSHAQKNAMIQFLVYYLKQKEVTA